MVYEELTENEKLKLISYLNWDYTDTDKDMLDVIEGKKKTSGAFSEKTLFARCLETLGWKDLVNLWTLEKCILLYDEKVKRMIFNKLLREEYDLIFTLLRTGSLPHTERSPEEIKKLRTAFLFNRRNRCKNREFKSQILKLPLD